MVADALSRLSMGNMSHVEKAKRNLLKDAYTFSRLGVQIKDSPIGGVFVHHNSEWLR